MAKYGLIGDPIATSRSPATSEQFFAAPTPPEQTPSSSATL